MMAGDRKAATTRVRDAIDKSVTTVEDIHKSIARLPFEALGESAFLRGPANEVRRLHDQAIGAVYGVIRRVNHRVGSLATGLVDELGTLGRAQTPSRNGHERGSGE